MSVFSKIVVALLIALSLMYVKNKFFDDFSIDFLNKEKNVNVAKTDERNQDKELNLPEIKQSMKEEVKTQIQVYFVTLDNSGKIKFETSKKQIDSKDNKLDSAVKFLLSGPTYSDKTRGIYSEIPKGTKLLGLQSKGKNIIINVSSDFQYGGGTDSTYARMKQLIKTVLPYTNGKNVYLYIDGKQADVIGGEGIMISQPLSENSLDGE